jgi:large subunit ribosomal protein L13
MQDKKYYNHSMYIGGLRTRTAQEMINNYADELVYLAVKGMVPGNRLGAAIMKKLFTYKNEGSPHNAQQPEVLKI